MGVIISIGEKNNPMLKAQRKKSKHIDAELWKDKGNNEKIMKLLLLGKVNWIY